MKNHIFVLLFSLFIFQSCTVYNNKTPVSLAEAANNGKVKVFNNAGQSFKFDKIELIDSAYYGMKAEDTLQINSNSLSKVLLVDTRKFGEHKNFIHLGQSIFYVPYVGAWGLISVNYERQLYRFLNIRANYAQSFESGSMYMSTLCFLTGKNQNHFEMNTGYALIYNSNSPGVTYSKYEQTFVLESGYRYTKGPIFLRVGIGWPHGNYIGMGFAF